MSQNQQPQAPLAWSEILKQVALRAEDDLRTKVKPAIDCGRSSLGTWLVRLGEKVQKHQS